MTYADLEAQAWAALPPIRKRLAGRGAVNDLLRVAVRNWSGEYLATCRDDRHRQQYARDLLGRVQQGYASASGIAPGEYGFVWVFILQAVASALIQWLVAWWLERHANRVLIEGWQQEMAT